MGRVLAAPTLDALRAASVRIAGAVVRTPLVKFDGDRGEPEIYLKLESLQPIGSFKLRGALNKMRARGCRVKPIAQATPRGGRLLSHLEHVHGETIGVNLAIHVGPKAIHLIALDTFDGHQWSS